MRVGWLACVPVAALAVAATASGPPRPKVDKTRPIRMEFLHVVRQGQTELLHLLESSFLVLNDQARAQAEHEFFRYLVRFADGSRAAISSTSDFSREDAYLLRTLLVDADRGEWVLLTIKGKTQKKGYGAAKAAIEEDERVLVGFETRRLRIAPEIDESLKKSNVGEVFRTAEPHLVELIQKLRQSFPRTSGAMGALFPLVMFADFLLLPAVPECAGCTWERLRVSVANDEPERAKPLDPEFEAGFGKWATWREVPRLKGN